MSKIGKTKKDILKILSKKQHTITDISNILHLSPSTVKQHFDELQEMGAIELVQNEFIRRWKYYKATPNFNLSVGKSENQFKNIVPYVVGSFFLLIAISAIILFSGIFHNASQGTSVLNSSKNLSVNTGSGFILSLALTDPPNVPANTKALILNYSSFSVNVLMSNGKYSWINETGSGSVNLMSLVNISQILGNTFLASGDKIIGASLSINSANIEIGNSTYPVVITQKKLYANLSSNAEIDSNSSILLDFSPTVSSLYSQNTTTFIMLPSIKAIFYGNYTNHGDNNYPVGKKINLSYNQISYIGKLKSNLTILYANITQLKNISNSSYSISIKIKNTGSKAISIKQVIFSGQLTSHIFANNGSEIIIRNYGFPNWRLNISSMPPIVQQRQIRQIRIISSMGNNAALNDDHNNMLIQGRIYSNYSNATFVNKKMFNGTMANKSGNFIRITIGGQEASEEDVGISMVFLHQLMFFVSQNASMILPQNNSALNMLNNSGYSIAPGAIATITFNGVISCGNGKIFGTFINGSTYNVIVLGNNGSFSHSNVTVN